MSASLSSTDQREAVDFDDFADDYESALGRGLAVSGEGADYFARGRVAWLARRLARLGVRPASALDFGCGTGSAIPHLLDLLGVRRAVGVDVSARSVDVARRRHAERPGASFAAIDPITADSGDPDPGAPDPGAPDPGAPDPGAPDPGAPDPDGAPGPIAAPLGSFDLAFCNGVFHHVPPADRPAALAWVRSRLRPGGLFALWENNSWNPGTRLVMSRCAFDRDAVTLSPPAARRLVRGGGLEVVETTHLFLFPRPLRLLRPLEPLVAAVPIGAQYQVLARRPADG